MVIGSHDFPAFSGWKSCLSADHKNFLQIIESH
jgi:4-alpha-glucanotransferase